MQDLKTGHLLGASPKAQFYGQIIGSLVGAVLSTAVYKMYVNVYEVPGPMFQAPTAFVWIFTARLVTGQGLPDMAWQASLIAGAVFVLVTVLRIVAASPIATRGQRGVSAPWRVFVPGGIAVAVGMFNVPSFTLARAIGGLIAWWWNRKHNARMTSSSAPDIDMDISNNETISNDDDDNNDPNTIADPNTNTSGGTSGEPATAPAMTSSQQQTKQADEVSSTVVVLASGLVLGEGIISILNLVLASAGVPHL